MISGSEVFRQGCGDGTRHRLLACAGIARDDETQGKTATDTALAAPVGTLPGLEQNLLQLLDNQFFIVQAAQRTALHIGGSALTGGRAR